MVKVGEQVEVRVLGAPDTPVATGTVAAILAPASDQDGELVELVTGVIGHVCSQRPGAYYQTATQPSAEAPSVARHLNGSGRSTDTALYLPISDLRVGSHVEVQRLDSEFLEYGRIAEVFDSSPGTQPIVQLTSGLFGAVTRVESASLPPGPSCLPLLRQHPRVVATPLGAPRSVICHVTSIIDTSSADVIITGTVVTSSSTKPSPGPSSEITARLDAVLLPFTPALSPTTSAAPTPEPHLFPPLPSPTPPAPPRPHSRGSQSADRSPRRPKPQQSPFPHAAAATPPALDQFAAASLTASPLGSGLPVLSTSSYRGADTFRQPGGSVTPPESHAQSLPSGRMPEAGDCRLEDLAGGVRSLTLGSLSNATLPAETSGQDVSAAGLQVVTPRGGVASQVVGVGDAVEMLWFERPEDEAACMAQQKDEAMGPKLAALQEECERLGLSSDQAETLLMLIDDATVPQVLDSLQKYTESFDAAANYLLNVAAANSDPNRAAPEEAASPAQWHGSAFDDFPSQALAPSSDPAPGPSAHSNACTLAAASDAWEGAAVPKKRKKKKGKGKALDGCFQTVPTPYGGAVAATGNPGNRSSLAAIVKSSHDAGPGPPARSKPYALQRKLNKRAAVATAFDDELPAFLLPFIAEHVSALEAANASASVHAASAPKQHPEWTKVKGKRSPEGKAPRTAEELVTLQSTQFREQCLKELGLIAERTTERLRLLTLCSTAANQNRVYDKSAVHRLEDCTSWINRAKQAIVKAHIIAARNTRLTNIPGIIDLHLMDRLTAESVVQGCIYELQRNLQTGDVRIITGVGNHSHNNKANLKPLVLEIIAEAGLESSLMDRNQGMIIMHVKP
eukprot:jgi/Ulvmu1/6008/UM026_0134.1